MTYVYTKDGLTFSNITSVVYNGKRYEEPAHEELLAMGFEVDAESMSEEDQLQYAKDQKIKEINEYALSDNVNEFYINTTTGWYDKSERSSLKGDILIYIEEGIEEFTLWVGNTSFELLTSVVNKFLRALDLYEIECSNITKTHINEVEALTTITEVEAYVITADYPEKVRLEIEN